MPCSCVPVIYRITWYCIAFVFSFGMRNDSSHFRHPWALQFGFDGCSPDPATKISGTTTPLDTMAICYDKVNGVFLL